MASKIKAQALAWPTGGLSEHMGFSNQEQFNPYTGQLPTCVSAQNVRNYDPTTGRSRGAQRPGHSKYVAAQANGSNFIQHLNHIETATSVAGTSVRSILGVAVSAGNVYSFTSGGFTLSTGGSGALSSTFPYLNSAVLFGSCYFVDGTNYKLWTAATNTVSAWTESTGNSLPANGSNKPRLCCTWRGRMVLSGIIGDEQNWFMSAVGDATNFNYGPVPVNVSQAVAGNNAPAGKCPDVINALIPFTDDLLIFGGSHTIWQMTNDPMDGGRLDLISDITGVAYGQAWCKDPSGLIYFFGSRGGLYVMTPGAIPQRLSFNRIENRLAQIDLSANVVRLAWDDRNQTVMIYVTPIAGGVTTNYAYDTRNRAFWPDTFANTGHNVSAAHAFEGDAVTARVLLLGCMDGYVRFIDQSAKNDDGTAINSFIWLGPLSAGTFNVRLHELQPTFGASSDIVNFDVFVGASAEGAFNAPSPRFNGLFYPGRGKSEQRRARGNFVYIRLSSNNSLRAWQFEEIVAYLEATGQDASRAF